MIEFKNIEIKYGDFVAIKDLNLTVGDGEFFTFLGPSGCGKTTTLRALVGQCRTDTDRWKGCYPHSGREKKYRDGISELRPVSDDDRL